jgi:hypothetical protein
VNEFANSPHQYAIRLAIASRVHAKDRGKSLLIVPLQIRRQGDDQHSQSRHQADARKPIQIIRREPPQQYASVKISPKMYVMGNSSCAPLTLNGPRR